MKQSVGGKSVLIPVVTRSPTLGSKRSWQGAVMPLGREGTHSCEGLQSAPRTHPVPAGCTAIAGTRPKTLQPDSRRVRGSVPRMPRGSWVAGGTGSSLPPQQPPRPRGSGLHSWGPGSLPLTPPVTLATETLVWTLLSQESNTHHNGERRNEWRPSCS